VGDKQYLKYCVELLSMALPEASSALDRDQAPPKKFLSLEIRCEQKHKARIKARNIARNKPKSN